MDAGCPVGAAGSFVDGTDLLGCRALVAAAGSPGAANAVRLARRWVRPSSRRPSSRRPSSRSACLIQARMVCSEGSNSSASSRGASGSCQRDDLLAKLRRVRGRCSRRRDVISALDKWKNVHQTGLAPPTRGGIRAYIDAKRDYLLTHTSHEHVLVVPGPRDEVRTTARRGRCGTHPPVVGRFRRHCGPAATAPAAATKTQGVFCRPLEAPYPFCYSVPSGMNASKPSRGRRVCLSKSGRCRS